jgi:PAS domain S-box-containing protein
MNWMNPLLRRLAPGCLILLSTGTLQALDPAKTVYQYNCQNWTRQNGLPADLITGVTQTKDGYIWIGTQKGMVRFDGIDFKVSNIALPSGQSQEIRSLSRGADGGMWLSIGRGMFGSFDEERFFPIADERWTTTSTEEETRVLEAQDGTIWTGSDLGLGRWVKGNPLKTSMDENYRNHILAFGESTKGRIWIGTSEQGLLYWENGKMLKFPDDSLKKDNIFAVAEGADGNIWVGTGNGLHCYDSKFQPVAIPAFFNEVKAILVDSHGVVWIGTPGAGLARYENGELTWLHKTDGLVSDAVSSIYEDREGSLWVGTQNGLSQITDVKFPIYSAQDGLPGSSVVAVGAGRTNGVWITTDKGLAYFDGKKVVAPSDPLLQQWFKRVFEARNGDLYAVNNLKQLMVFSGQKLARTYTNDNWPTAMAEDSESILVAVADKLFRIRDGKMVPYKYAGRTEPAYYWIFNLCVARDGSIWVASNDGVFRLKDGAVKQWSTAEGLSDNNVSDIFEDVDGAVWAALPSGIARIKADKLININQQNGLGDNNIYEIVPDNEGNFWMDSVAGILRASRQSLNNFADGKTNHVACEIFDGLESIKFTGHTKREPVAAKSADGRIWFPNPEGLAMIDPAHLITNTVVPPVRIQQIRINGIELQDRKIPALPVGGGRMEFHFAALSYIAPQKAQLRYKLEGFDKDWVDAEGRRSVLYNNLRPGKYSFMVQGCNADGVWNTAGDAFEVALPPAFYQTGWFVGLCILMGIGCLGLIYRWLLYRAESKQRRLKEANDLLELKVRERTAELAKANAELDKEIQASLRADEALRAEQRLLRTMINALPMSIGCIDKTGRFVFANNLVSTFFGKPLSEIEGRLFGEVMPAEMYDKQKQLIEECLTGKVVPFVHDYTLANGSIVIGQGAFAPVAGQDGTFIGAVYGVMDITERRRAEEELLWKTAFFEALVESSLDGILVVNSERRKILQNQQTIDLWQIPRHLVEGNDDGEQANYIMNMAKNPQQFLAEVNRLYENPNQTDRREIELKNGTVLDRYSSSVIGRDGRYYGRIWMFRDITTRKQLELEMENTHQQLMVASRQAGMAEVATGVLHNVGNVLNSVNVSASLVVDSVRTSRAASLSKVVELLDKHQDNLAEFLTRDEKGKQLHGFLAGLNKHLAGERAALLEELRSLTGNIEHIKEIVAMQQANAHRFGVVETAQAVELMENALKMNEAAYSRHRVGLAREFEEVPPVLVDKHKVLQILINLLQNAKRACSQSTEAERKVTVRIRKNGEQSIRMEVADNGVGIPPENLTRIFAHGFTTQADGHGFGLHTGALTAKQLGGTLTAHSAGSGLGATFILELPIQNANARPVTERRANAKGASKPAPDETHFVAAAR